MVYEVFHSIVVDGYYNFSSIFMSTAIHVKILIIIAYFVWGCSPGPGAACTASFHCLSCVLWHARFNSQILSLDKFLEGPPQSTHRVAMADFWRTFRHDGKISTGWWGRRRGVHGHPPFTLFTITYKVAVYTPAERKDTSPYFISTLYVLCGGLQQPHREKENRAHRWTKRPMQCLLWKPERRKRDNMPDNR